MESVDQKRIAEMSIVYLLTVALLFLVHRFSQIQWISSLSPLIFFYPPFLVAWNQKVSMEYFGLDFPSPRPSAWKVLGKTILWTLVPYFLLYGLWLHWRFGLQMSMATESSWLGFFWMILTQVFLVGLAEEVFFRGYLQTRLSNLVCLKRFSTSIFGFTIQGGWPALILCNIAFATVHLVGHPHPKALLTFFPGLVFSWLWLRTRNVWISALYHALCNLSAAWFFGIWS